MSKIYILGSDSFVGKVFYSTLKDHNKECYPLSKKELNFLKPETFSSFNFNNSVIIDFINVNNGVEKEIMDCNYLGFTFFCKYLLSNAENFKYVYVSSVSVISEEIVNANAYVRSKKLAEDFLTVSGIDYRLIRLSYPIGKNENKNRLITRLINNLKADKHISVSHTMVNLNSVEEVAEHIYLHLLQNKELFVSNNWYVDLCDIVLFLKQHLNSKSNIEMTEAAFQFTPISETPYVANRSIYETLLEMI